MRTPQRSPACTNLLTCAPFSIRQVVSKRRTLPIRVLNTCASYPRTDEEEARTKNVWMKGHTDSGTITLLWSQPVVALQIMSPDGKWRYVRYVPNGIVRTGTAYLYIS